MDGHNWQPQVPGAPIGRRIRGFYAPAPSVRDLLWPGRHEHHASKLHENSAGCQFIQGLDLEKCGAHGATHSGISTKDGSIVQLEVKNSPCDAAGTDFVIIHLVYDGLINIRDGSVDVFE